MAKYERFYTGHTYGQRQAVLQMGLVKENELALLSDDAVEKLINESDYLIFQDGSSFALLPKRYEDELIWINR